MFTIENLAYNHCVNDQCGFYSATLVNENMKLDVTLSQNGDTIAAYESSTHSIYDLRVPDTIHNIKDLRNGDRIDIFCTITEP